jgi:UV DNA damage endonuclease
MSVNIGYCCICLKINEGLKKKDAISVNRGMIKKTFDAKGIAYASELTILNLKDCLKVLKFNLKNDILVYRMSSEMFPWFTHYNLEDLPNWDIIKNLLKQIGDFVLENKMRVGFHPGQFVVLNSENLDVVEKSIDELNKHSQMLDLMGLPANNYYSINIHLNTTKPTLELAAQRFCNSFWLLNETTKKRLTVENDDKGAQYTVQDLYRLVHQQIGIPLIADSLHHACHTGGYSWEDSFKLAVSTWGDIKPLCHHSSSKKLHEDASTTVQTHTDFLYEPFQNFGIDVDIELECKMKDVALFKYRNDYIKG